MKTHKLKLLFIFAISVILLSSCSSNYDGDINYEEQQENSVLLDSTVPNRKIIYQAQATLFVDSIELAIEDIRDLLEADEWFDSENRSSSYGELIVRVKTENLETFITSLNTLYDVSNYNKSATDISLQYQSTEHKIESFEAERQQLVILYAGASLSDMIIINSRIAEIDLELGELEGTLTEFDSLVNYSKVTLALRLDTVVSRLPFSTRIIDGFVGGFNALISFFDGLIIILVTLLPFAIVFVPSGYGIYRFYQYSSKKKKEKRNKE